MATIATPVTTRHRLTVADFHRMADVGIFQEDDRVELIEGEIIDRAPIGSGHTGTVTHYRQISYSSLRWPTRGCPTTATSRSRSTPVTVIPEVWLVDLEDRRLHVYTSPSASGYLECRILAAPGMLAPAELPGCPVDLSGLFP
ncbi:MAG: hypothetical protein ACREV8_12020 [Gammaproteobacteria bacterium]